MKLSLLNQNLNRRLKKANLLGCKREDRMYSSFAKEYGLIWFKNLNNKSEDIKVKGLTLCLDHKDYDYLIGSYDGYDVVLVKRINRLFYKGKIFENRFLILSIELKNKNRPHVIMATTDHKEVFFKEVLGKFRNLKELFISDEASNFDKYYHVYSTLSDALIMEDLFSKEVLSIIETHIRPLDIELDNKTLYLYAKEQLVTKKLLETMLENGVWLARKMDKVSKANIKR